MVKSYTIRGHHILLLNYPVFDPKFLDKIGANVGEFGYSKSTIEKVRQITEAIQKDDTIKIKIVADLDDVCKGCSAMDNPKNLKTPLYCKTGVSSYDKKVFEELGLEEGKEYSSKQIKQRLKKNEEYVNEELKEMLETATKKS